MSPRSSDRQKYLTERLKDSGASLIGYGDVSFMNPKLPTAVSIGVALDIQKVKNLHLDEKSFHDHLISLNPLLKKLLKLAGNILAGWGYEYWIPPISVLIESREQLKNLDVFPHKTAAVAAGLGWIGKSSLLVTPQFGPRIKLATVLTDADFETSSLTVSDLCGKCSLCVEACPYGAIKGANWRRGDPREKLLDADICNDRRLDFVAEIGRKSSCGLCLQACEASNP